MCNDMKILVGNKNFMLVLVCFSLVYSVYAAFGFVINPLLEPIGYQPSMIAVIAMLTVIFGTAAVMSVGKYLDKSNKYLLSLKIACAASALAVASGVLTLSTGTVWGAVVFAALMGVAVTPIMTICFSLATECTYPVQPALVTGGLMSCAQVILFGVNYFYLYVVSAYNSSICFLVMAVSPAIALIFSFFVKEDLRRLSSILDISITSGLNTPKLQYK